MISNLLIEYLSICSQLHSSYEYLGYQLGDIYYFHVFPDKLPDETQAKFDRLVLKILLLLKCHLISINNFREAPLPQNFRQSFARCPSQQNRPNITYEFSLESSPLTPFNLLECPTSKYFDAAKHCFRFCIDVPDPNPDDLNPLARSQKNYVSLFWQLTRIYIYLYVIVSIYWCRIAYAQNSR